MVTNQLPKSFAFVNSFKRYSGNPILHQQGALAADCIFNPGAVATKSGVEMLCRCINFKEMPKGFNWSVSSLVFAHSQNGFDFTLQNKPFLTVGNSCYQGGFEDPRLVFLPEEGLYALSYTGVYNYSKTVGMLALSKNLVDWDFLGECLPGRSIAITDRRINGEYYAYFGNSSIFLAHTKDLKNWVVEETPAISPRPNLFDNFLCEAVAAPIINNDGILLLYNGAATGKFNDTIAHNMVNETGERVYGFRGKHAPCCYSIGWALFERNNPAKLIARSTEPILTPQLPYECYGIAPYTVFGNALVNFNGRWILYYGCADSRIAAAVSDPV